MKAKYVFKIILVISILGVTLFSSLKIVRLEKKHNNNPKDYYQKSALLQNELRGQYIGLKNIPNLSKHQDETTAATIALFFRPSGCMPCIDKSINYYFHLSDSLGILPALVGCFDNNRHVNVWFTQRNLAGNCKVMQATQLGVQINEPFLGVLLDNRLVSTSHWDPSHEEISRKQFRLFVCSLYDL